MNKFDKFLQLLTKEGNEHREIARKFMQQGLNDVKYHDGMADQAIALSIEFQELFQEELKCK